MGLCWCWPLSQVQVSSLSDENVTCLINESSTEKQVNIFVAIFTCIMEIDHWRRYSQRFWWYLQFARWLLCRKRCSLQSNRPIDMIGWDRLLAFFQSFEIERSYKHSKAVLHGPEQPGFQHLIDLELAGSKSSHKLTNMVLSILTFISS